MRSFIHICQSLAIFLLPCTALAEWQTFKSKAGTEVRAEIVGVTFLGKLRLRTVSETIEVDIDQLDLDSQRQALLDLHAMIPQTVANGEKPVKKRKLSPEDELSRAWNAYRRNLTNELTDSCGQLRRFVLKIKDPANKRTALLYMEKINREMITRPGSCLSLTDTISDYLRDPESAKVVVRFKALLSLTESTQDRFDKITADSLISKAKNRDYARYLALIQSVKREASSLSLDAMEEDVGALESAFLALYNAWIGGNDQN